MGHGHGFVVLKVSNPLMPTGMNGARKRFRFWEDEQKLKNVWMGEHDAEVGARRGGFGGR